jgi:hypothetical protein
MRVRVKVETATSLSKSIGLWCYRSPLNANLDKSWRLAPVARLSHTKVQWKRVRYAPRISLSQLAR